MTITTEPTALSYNGDGSTVAFSITWKYFAQADVKATLRNAAGAETTWVLNTDYTLTAAGVSTGGTLTATTAPASGQTLVITLDPSNTQDSSLPRGGDFPSPTVEDELDQAAQRDAKLEVLWDRSLRVPITDLRTGSSLELPIDTLRASKYLKFDGNGVPTAAAGTATLGETGLLSQDTESELTIASGSVTPTVATHSIDTEADAATDNLDTIVTTNLENGRLLLIRGENASRVITIRDSQGGAGQIHTAGGTNIRLDGTTNYLLFQRRGADWYEVNLTSQVRLWTPAITFATPGNLNVVYSTQSGVCAKIGSIIIITFAIVTSTFTHTTASGALRVSGAPFTPDETYDLGVGSVRWAGITKANYTHVNASTTAAQTYLEFNASGSGQAESAVAAADMPTGGTVSLRGTVTYFTNLAL